MKTNYNINVRILIALFIMTGVVIGLWSALNYFQEAVDTKPDTGKPVKADDSRSETFARMSRNGGFDEGVSPGITDGRASGNIDSQTTGNLSGSKDPGLESGEVTLNEADIIPDEFVLGFRNESDREKFILLAESEGFEVLGVLKHGNFIRLKVPDGAKFNDLMAGSGLKIRYSPNHYVLTPQPIDSKNFGSGKPQAAFGNNAVQWLGISGDNSQWGKGVKVAVLDTGVQQHPLLGHIKIKRINLAGGETLEGANAGHGTAVASLIAGYAEDFRSVAPGVGIISVPVASSEGVGDAFTLAEGIVEAVDNGADLINVCMGTYGINFVLADAVEYASANGVAIIAAAGNDAVDQILFPARYPDVIAVTGVDASGQKASFANEGDQLDFAAPALAVAAAASEGERTLFTGTSAAAPFVTGLLAYLMGEGMSASDAEQVLKAHSNDAGPVGGDSVYGEGIINAERVLRRDQQGIYDAALADIYIITGADGSQQAVVTAQNRGTSDIGQMKLSVMIDGKQVVQAFDSVGAGSAVSMQVPVISEKGAPVDITAGVSIPGEEDVDMENNGRRSILFPVVNRQ